MQCVQPTFRYHIYGINTQLWIKAVFRPITLLACPEYFALSKTARLLGKPMASHTPPHLSVNPLLDGFRGKYL